MTREHVPGLSIVRLASRLVPESHRDEWIAEWTAEVVHAWHHREDGSDVGSGWSLRLRCAGALRDAAWMRQRHHTATPRASMFGHDFRYALRSLARKPGFTAVVIGTLALCIGANTAIFSIVNSILLDGLPYSKVDKLVHIWSNDTGNNRERNEISVGDYRDMRSRTRTLSSIAAYFPNWNATYTAPDAAERLDIGVVSANFLHTLGIAPAIGRSFAEGEDVPGAANVVILSHAFWTRHLGQDENVVGKTITLDAQPYEVIGVMPPDFVFPGARVDLLAPLPMLGSFLERREVHLVTAIGRLRDNTNVAEVQRDLSDIAAQLEKEFPNQNAGFGATVVPTEQALLGDVRRPILILFGAVTLVLLIGCANVANLMLARASSRRHELSLRAALGAGRSRIAKQLLTESAVIAGAAAIIGVVLAYAATQGLTKLLPPQYVKLSAISISVPVLVFTVAVAVVATIACGLYPALQGARLAMHDALKEMRGNSSFARRRAQGALVVSELALSLLLVVAAGLLINSFARLTATDPGFRTDNLTRFKVSLAGAQYSSPPVRLQRFSSLMSGIRALPGVAAAGTVSRFPLHDSNITTSVLVEGRAPVNQAQLPDADLRIAGGDYFKAMGVRLIAGRYLTDHERIDSGSTPVAVINQTAALQLFNDPAPIGKRMQLGGHANAPFFEVVGVVADIRDASLREAPRPQVFQAAAQTAPRTLSIVIQHEGPNGAILSGARSVLRSLDPTIPIYDVQTVEDVLTAASVNDRFTMMLLSSFSGLALLLAVIGTYGVIAYGVTERTREIGVRMALGAPQSSVRTMVLREGVMLLAFAVPIGLFAVWASTRLMERMLFNVSALDASTTFSAALVLCLAALAACYIPARRASRVDPLQAIRAE